VIQEFNLVINGEDARRRAVDSLQRLVIDHEKGLAQCILQEWTPPGSDNQLRTIYMWYAEIARDKSWDDVNGWRRYCKYHFGVPVLTTPAKPEDDTTEEDAHLEFFTALFSSLDYEKRVAAMEYVDVVSIMNHRQRSRYLQAIHDHFTDVRLTIPPKKKRGERGNG